MTKFNIFKLMVLALVASPLLSFAQPTMGAWEFDGDTTNKNYYINYVGGRVVINSPSNLAGPVTHTISNDGVGTGDWGASIKSVGTSIVDVDVVKADPYEACGTLNNSGSIAGKIALVKRGNCEFGAKALQAQQAGAVAVIIVNNVPGPAVGMGAGAQGGSVTIPCIMVSDVDGAAIEAALGSNAVKVTLSTWGNGFANDIGFVGGGIATSHAVSIPLDQIKGSTASAFKGFTGAVVANFGTSTANTVKVRAILYWTPTGGAKTEVRRDSVSFTNFAAIDSIRTPFVDVLYDLNPTTTGQYDVEYEAIPDFTDQSIGDNKAKYTFYIHNTIYSKGRYDFDNNKPFSGVGYTIGDGTTEFTWGNFVYMEKGGYQVDKVQVSLSKQNAQTNNSMVGISPVQILVYKWVDATPGDTILAGPEFTPVGFGTKAFVAGDTSGQVHDVVIKNLQATGPCVTEANTWYWVAAAVPTTTFLGADGVTNHFVRSWGRSHATAKARDIYSPMFNANYSGLSSATSPLQHFPFERYFFMEDSIRFSQQRKGLVPSLPIHMSLFKVGVDEVNAGNIDVTVYPNPATDVINVSVKLEKEAKEVNYTLMSINGTRIADEKHTNVKNDKYSISTANLPAGTYMLIMNIDGEQQMRQFSVIK